MQYVDCFYYYIRYRTYNALYHSCSTDRSVLEESGQVYLSCARIPGSLLFSFSREGLLDLACLLACVDTAKNELLEVLFNIIQSYFLFSIVPFFLNLLFK